MYEDGFEHLSSYWVNNVGDQSDVLFVCKRYSDLPVSLEESMTGILRFPVDSEGRNLITFKETVIKRSDVASLLDQISTIDSVEDVLSLASKYGTLYFDSFDGVSAQKQKRDSVQDWFTLSNDLNAVMDFFDIAHSATSNHEMRNAKIRMTLILNKYLRMSTYGSEVYLYGEDSKVEDSFPQLFEYTRPRDFISFLWRIILDSVISAENNDGNSWVRCPYCKKFDLKDDMHVLKSGLAVHHEHYRAWYEKQKRAEGKRNYKCMYCGKRDSLKNMNKMENKTNMYYHEKCLKEHELNNKGQTSND